MKQTKPIKLEQALLLHLYWFVKFLKSFSQLGAADYADYIFA